MSEARTRPARASPRRARRSARPASGASCSQVALVGYTNAGKSTLLNRLTHAGVLVEDQLFSTLDPTVRRLHLPGRRDRARSPTRSASCAGCRTSSSRRSARRSKRSSTPTCCCTSSTRARPTPRRASTAVDTVLREIDAGDVPRLIAWNKADARRRPTMLNGLLAAHPGSVAISAATGDGRRRAARARSATGCGRWRASSSSSCRTTAATCSPRCTAPGEVLVEVHDDARHARAGPRPDAVRPAASPSSPWCARAQARQRMATRRRVPGFVPPPYPYDRLDALKRLADSLPGGVVDCSIGTPCDPVPEVARAGRGRRARRVEWATRRRPAAPRCAARPRLDRPALRRQRRAPSSVGACVGTKELVASLPHLLRLRNPARDTVLVSRDRVPDATRWARPSPAAARCRCRSTPTGTSTSTRSAPADAERALVLWINEPGQPDVVGRRRRRTSPRRRRGRGERGIVVASDECYAEFAPEPATILGDRPRRRARGAQRVEALEPRGHARRLLRGRPRPRALPRRDPQARGPDGADAGAGRGRGRARRRRARRRATRALRRTARARARRARRARARARRRPMRCSTCGCAPPTAPTTAGRSRPGSRTRRACSSRPATSTARPAPITCGSRSCSRASASSSRSTASRTRTDRRRSTSGRRREADDAAVGGRRRLARRRCPVAEAHDAVRVGDRACSTGARSASPKSIDGEVVVNEWAKHAILMWFRVQEMQIDRGGPVRVRRQAPAEARLRGRRRARRARRVGPLRRVPRAGRRDDAVAT